MPFRPAGIALILYAVALGGAAPAGMPAAAAPEPSYADLVDLSDSAPLVLKARIIRQSVVEPERAPGVRPGWVRLYVQAGVEALLFGKTAVGRDQAYLVDVPLDARGKAPKLTKTSVLLFARPAANRPGELQLVTPDAQIPSTPERDARVRAIIGELVTPGAPGRIGGVREAINVAGDLAGEGETQLFLTTKSGAPVAITVSHKTGEPPRWSVSFSEVVETDARPPVPDTLSWYRLGCFLPRRLPPTVNLSEGDAQRGQAEADYEFVLRELGTCERTRVFGLAG
ncbi:MAG: hypothetical protein ABIQ81_02015 [Novosphingobium sp.]